MTDGDLPGLLRVPAREVPAPAHLSAEARAILAMGLLDGPAYPAPEDANGWHAHVAAQEILTLPLARQRVEQIDARTEQLDLAGVRAYAVTPAACRPADARIMFYIHGGALVAGGGEMCRLGAILLAAEISMRVIAVDYRMPPDHPYPVPLDDCVTAYRATLEDHRPEQVVIRGESAGGNLAAATILRARDEGLPLPACVVLATPEVDLTESGDSFRTNIGLDNVLTRSLMPANLLYAAGHDLSHPYVSPLFADFSQGFPPTMLTAGTRDLFLSNAVRMHRFLRRGGVDAELHLLEAGGHGGFFGTAPEDQELNDEVLGFIDRYVVPSPAPSPT